VNLEQWDGGEALMNERPDSMLEHTGTVIDADAHSALVETVRRSACGQCGAGDSCGTSVLAGLFRQRRHSVRVKHDLALNQGDRVVLGIPESALLRAAMCAYMVPMLLMIAFAMLATLAGLVDLQVFAGSVAGLFSGLYLAGEIRTRSTATEIVLLRRAGAQTAAVDFVAAAPTTVSSEYKRGKQ